MFNYKLVNHVALFQTEWILPENEGRLTVPLFKCNMKRCSKELGSEVVYKYTTPIMAVTIPNAQAD